VLKCSAEISDTLISELKTTLGENGAIDYADNTLTMKYLFPDCNFSLIRPKLTASGVLDGAGIINRVRYMMLACKEKNESDHLQHHPGWRCVIEDIHVGYFKLNHQTTPTDRKKHWQK